MENQFQDRPLTFSHLLQQAIHAHNWTSFSPEKRGASLIAEMSAEVDEDLQLLASLGADQQQMERYKQGYEQKLRAWLHAKSNCMSSMITGPARFPTRRAENANNREQAHYDHLQDWRKRVRQAWERRHRRQKIEAAGGPLAILRRELEQRRNSQVLYKKLNRAVRNTKEPSVIAETLGISLDKAEHLLKPDWAGRVGVPGYKLSNNLANIKRIEARIRELESKEAAAAKGNGAPLRFEGGELLLNAELDRVQIFYDKKPDADTIARLKKSAFKWAPSQGAWQRQMTSNAIEAAEKITGLKLRS